MQGANALDLGAASSNTGAVVFQGSGGAGTLTLQGPTTPNTGDFTLSIPAITANANVCTDNSICAGYAATPASGNYIQQVPTSTAANTITPATSGVVGLTVNGTNMGTAATAVNVLQGGAATGVAVTSSSTGDGQDINLTNTSGTQTNGLAITRNGTGTTTNLLNLTNTAGTATNGILLSGTYTNLINAGSAFTVTNAGNITNAGTLNGQTISSSANVTGTVAIQGANALRLGTGSRNTGGVVFQGSGGAGMLTLQGSTTPNAGNFTLSIPAITANANVCTDNSVCSGYAPSAGGNYIARNTNDTSSASFAGNLLGLTNTNSGAAGVLSLTNSGTNSTLNATTNANPTAGQAVLFASDTNASPSGNLIDLQAGASPTSQFSVNTSGNVTAVGTYNTNTFTGSALTFGTAGTATIQSAASQATEHYWQCCWHY